MLGKKQNIKSNDEWLNAFDTCTSIYSKEYIDDLEQRTIARIKKVASKYKNICSGWIAGKDSLALHHLLVKSGINFTPVMWRGINEYPCMVEWIQKNQPNNILFEIIDKFDFDFLEKHPEYLFCKNGTRQNWMSEKWKKQKQTMKKYNFDLFIAGRRIKDGNNCGKKEDDYIVKKDYDTFAPLAEWNHEEVLAYIKYNNIELPPFYSFKRGFLIGSIAMGEWTEYASKNNTDDEVWEEIWDIDKTIVENAANYLTSAKEFLKKKGA